MTRRPVRIANASGFFGDRMTALSEVVQGGPIDVVTGDYLAEVTMMVLAKQRAKDPRLGYASSFVAQLKPVLATILERGIKVVVNAGGLNPHGLASEVRKLGSAKVAVIEGDDLMPRLEELRATNDGFRSLETGALLGHEVVTANAYLGGWGIARALEGGADIVVCPRVTDASLVVGVAAWWHGWARDDWNALAGAVAAGHVIECGPQATGGNYSSFRRHPDTRSPAFPITEIAADGSSVITKHDGTPGIVTVDTVTAQLVYEIGSPRYLNPDVVAHLDTIELQQIAPDRVALRGTRGSPPPPTTKVAMTCRGPFRNEMIVCFVGLDIDEKIAMFSRAILPKLARADVVLQRIGSASPDAASQDEATVLLRVIATSSDERVVARGFSAAIIEEALSSYPGLFTMGLPGPPTEVGAYWPTLVLQSEIRHTVAHADGRVEVIAPSPVLPTAMLPQPAVIPFDGETRRGPLGSIVDARSGDKGANANVGLWVRDDAAYAWLRSLSIEQLRGLLPEARDLPIDRWELPNLRALNFVIHGLLDGGAVATLRFDRQAKALGEFIRSRVVDLPA